jgi:hypothetical protein
MRRWWMWLGLVACGGDLAGEAANRLPTGQAGPPAGALTVPAVVIAGRQVPIGLRVSSAGLPWGVWAAVDGAPGRACPGVLAPVCLDIGAPFAVQVSGTSTSRRVSATWTPPREERLALQGVAVGASSMDISRVEVVEVLSEGGDRDADGVANGAELDLGWDPLVADGDGDGLRDGDELAIGADPRRPDTDGDGLSDRGEFDRGTNPTRRDTDGDRLNDLDEVARGTDPLRADTDGDLVDDGEEIADGTDPLDPRDPFDWEPVDTGSSDTAAPRPCLEDEILGCWGGCVPDTRADEVCDRWLDCPRLRADRLDCEVAPPAPVCAPGTILGCWGDCVPFVDLGDGACEAELACPMRQWDGGDCPAPVGATVQGSVRIAGAADVAALAGVVEVEGTLVVAPGAPDPLVLPELVAAGAVVFEPGGPAVARLPALLVVDGAVDLRSDTLRELEAPALEVVVHDVSVTSATALEALRLPALAHIGDALVLRDAPRLAEVALGDLTTTHGLNLSGQLPALDLRLPRLTSVGGRVFLDDLEMGELDLSALEALDGAVELEDVVVSALRLGALASPLQLSGDLDAAVVDLGSVTEVVSLFVRCGGDCAWDLSAVETAGTLIVEGPGASVQLDRLVAAASLRLLAGTADVSLPALTACAGTLEARGASVAAPLLATASRVDVTATGAADLRALVSARVVAASGASVRLDALAVADQLTLGVTGPNRVELPELVQLDADVVWPPPCCGRPGVGSLVVSGSPGATVVAPRLERLAQGDLGVGRVELPVLQEALLLDARGVVVAPALTRVGQLRFYAGSGPPSLDAVAEVTQLDVDGGVVDLVLPALTRATGVRVTSRELMTLSLPALVEVGLVYVPRWVGARSPVEGVKVSHSSLPRLALPNLARVSWLDLQGGDLVAVDLPRLEVAESVLLMEEGDRYDWREVLTITTTGFADPPVTTALALNLPSLASVASFDVLHERRLATLWLPALTDLRGRLRVHDVPSLTAVGFPALEETTAVAWINLMFLPSLTTVALPRAHTLGRLASVDTGLEVLRAPALVHLLDHLTAYDNASLREVRAPLLRDTVQVYLDNNAALTTVELPRLTTAGGLWLRGNGSVAALALPRLADVTGDLVVSENASLWRLALPALAHAGEVTVVDNPSVDGCVVEAWLAGVTVDGAVTVSPGCGP